MSSWLITKIRLGYSFIMALTFAALEYSHANLVVIEGIGTFLFQKTKIKVLTSVTTRFDKIDESSFRHKWGIHEIPW